MTDDFWIEPLSFSHQRLLEHKLRQLNLSLSEYSFANLYLFRKLHHYEVMKLDDEIFLRGLTRDKVPFIMLTSNPAQISKSLLQKVISLAQILFPIPENWLNLLDNWILQASFKEEDTDYLYTLSKLDTYPGRHLDGKRNQVKQLLNHYEVKRENFSQQIRDAQDILDNWQAKYNKDSDQTDYSSCQEAIRNFHQLHLHGHIVYVNQQPAGFVMGEWTSKDYYTVHFAKALHSIKGIYQYLFQELAQSLEGTCSWINLEQDLGVSAIRYSKLSYQPDSLVKKWRVQLQVH
jgi:hypothetical protein